MLSWRTHGVLVGLAIVIGVAIAAEPVDNAPPPGPGLELIQRSCIGCHDIYMVLGKRKTPDEWATIVGLMADRGAEITPEEMSIIEDYLSSHYSTSSTAQ